MEHVIPRFGIPVGTDSDDVTHFTLGTKQLALALGIKGACCIAYHPQSSGHAKRTNHTVIRADELG